MHPPDALDSSPPFASTSTERRWFGDDDSMVPHKLAEQSQPGQVARFVGLRPLPDVARHALSLVQTLAPSRGRLVALIQSDVALAAKVIRYCGTVYRADGPVLSLDDAITRVGRRMLPGLVAAAATEAPIGDPTGALGALLRHSLGTAVIARELALMERMSRPDEIYTAGLFHDIGRLMRLQCGLDAPDDVDAEIEQDGFDHAVLGAEILTSWGLCANVHRLVALHHHPGRGFRMGGSLPARIGAVEVADRLDAVFEAQGSARDLLDTVQRSTFGAYLAIDGAQLTRAFPRLAAVRATALAEYPARLEGAPASTPA